MAYATETKDNTKDAARPDFRSKAALAQFSEDLELCRDLAIGPKAIRAKSKYLPQETGEHADSYGIRLSSSLLFNTYKKTLDALVGMGFKVNPVLDTDVPAQVRRDFEDIDLAGTHGDVFLRIAFWYAVRDGHSFIMVDSPPPLQQSITSAAPIPDAADDQAAGRRPYWVTYEKHQAYNWASDRINGETVLTRITFRECVTVADGEYGEKDVIRYRVLKLPKLVEATPGRPAVYGPMQWVLFEEVPQRNSKKPELKIVGSGVTKLTRIPVVVIYTNKTGFLMSEPPLAGLAWLNLGHYRQWSDLLDQVRYLAPTAVRKLDTEQEINKDQDPKKFQTIQYGRKQVITIAGKDSDFKYESHDPNCIKPAHDLIKDIEQHMSAEGLSIIAAKDEKEVTLGEKEMDQGERMSSLALWIRQCQDSGEQLLRFHALYYGINDGGSLILTLSGVTADAVKAIEAPMPGTAGAVQDQNAAPVA